LPCYGTTITVVRITPMLNFNLAGKPAITIFMYRPSESAHVWPWLVAACIVLAGMIAGLIFFFRWRVRQERERVAERSEAQQRLARSEMRALRSQMNPHFIFNAINSIQHYVLTNEKELANKYLVKFSRLMRNILELSKEELISLKDELETARLYLEIESLRFNNAFEFNIDSDPSLDVGAIRMPPLLIQPFIENAIWHGLLLKEGPKRLNIIIRGSGGNVEIVVDDNGIGREMAGKFQNEELRRKSFGFEITKERLEQLQLANGVTIDFEVEDKMENGSPAGTQVRIKIKHLI
jgi:LytS/YehU family sensor histidine kinase